MLVTFQLSHHGHILHGLLEMLNLLPNIFVSIGKIQGHPLMNLWSSIQWFSIPDVHFRICINLKLVIPIVQFDWLVTVLESCFIFLQPLICCCSVLVNNSQLYLPRNLELEKYWYVGCGIVTPARKALKITIPVGWTGIDSLCVKLNCLFKFIFLVQFIPLYFDIQSLVQRLLPHACPVHSWSSLPGWWLHSKVSAVARHCTYCTHCTNCTLDLCGWMEKLVWVQLDN